jgi:hypothetical protein
VRGAGTAAGRPAATAPEGGFVRVLIKDNVDMIERNKDEETKRFLNPENIHFDFGVLVRIKECIVDLSMEHWN